MAHDSGGQPVTPGKKAARSRQVNALKLVNQWNALYPPGTPVTVELDSGEIRATTTRSNAQMLGADFATQNPGHTAVIWLEGFEGCYHLLRVRAKGGMPK
jgi:hypothetical protein